MKEYTNIYYIGSVNVIGGIETFLYELARKYKDKDLTILYSNIDSNQLYRLQKYARCIKYRGQKIKCKRAFFNNNVSIIDNIDAEEYIQILHGDYKALKWKPDTSEKINRYYAVSKSACNSFKELTGKECGVCYNPVKVDKPKRILKLISATRLTKEKGKDRIEILANALNKANIPYVWLIFTDDDKAINNPNVFYMKPRLDVRDYIAQADYTVQLSDTEAYSYTVLESLILGVPVIVTPVPSFYEQGINENNSIVIDFDMNNIPIKDIYEKEFNFTYTPRKDGWDKLLLDGKNTYQEELNKKYLVEATDEYEKNYIVDKDLNRVPLKGEQWIINQVRLKILTTDNEFNKPFVKMIKPIEK